MTSTYVNDLRLNEMATGDASGSWGTVTNTNLELIGEALGYGTEAITTNADTHTSTIADGATDPIRAIFIKYTGTLDSACTITIGPNTVNKFCFIHNATSGSQSIIISQGSGANVTIATGQTKGVYLDGAGSGAAVIDAFAALSVVDLLVDDALTVTGVSTFGGGTSISTAGVLSLEAGGSLTTAAGNDLNIVYPDGRSLFFKEAGTTTLTLDNAQGATFAGVVTANAGVVVDNFTLDGTTLALSSGDFTVDVAGDIILDAAGGDIFLKENGTHYGSIKRNNNDLQIHSETSNEDILFVGNDNGSVITALTLDMSEAGTATFNNSLLMPNYIYHTGDTDTYFGFPSANTVKFVTGNVESFVVSATDVVVNDGSNDINFRVESNGNANMLFVDGGVNSVGIGTVPPAWRAGLSDVGFNVGVSAALYDQTGGGVFLVNNWYRADDNTLTYRNTNEAQYIAMDAGIFSFQTAPSGSAGSAITFTETMKIDATGAVTKPLQPAFSVNKGGTAQENIAVDTDVTLTWSAEVFDVNADFGAAGFTAPVTGKYHLNLSVRFQQVDADHAYIVARIVTSNRSYTWIIDPDFGQDAQYFTGAVNVLADMDASDTAYAVVVVGAGAAVTDISGDAAYTYFTGFLAC